MGNQASTAQPIADIVNSSLNLRELSEPELLRRVKDREVPAFEELVTRYMGLALSTAMRLTRNRDDAEDIAQEALWRAYRKIGSFDDSRPFAPWLYKITLNLVYTRLNRRKRERALSIDELQPRFDSMGMQDPSEPAMVPDIEERLATRETAERAEQIIAELPEEYGTVVWMHDVAGISPATLIALLKLSVPAFKSRLHRGRLAVRKRLLEGLSVPAAPAAAGRAPMAMGSRMGITCREVVQSLLIDYLQNELSDGDRDRFEEHLAQCDRCGPFVESYRKIARGLARMPEPVIPREMVETTLAFVRESLESGRYLNRDWAKGLSAAFGGPFRRFFRRRT